MGKTTNILDLNNRLTKVEKENVAQNSYTSLKNKPKINSVTLTGNKSLADIGAAAAGDITDINTAIGDISELEITATNLVGAINEVNGKIAFPTLSANANDIKGLNIQVAKNDNYMIATLITGSTDADKLTIEYVGNNNVIRIKNYINNVIVKESAFTADA